MKDTWYHSVIERADCVYEVFSIKVGEKFRPIMSWFVGGLDDMPSTMEWTENEPMLMEDVAERFGDEYIQRGIAASARVLAGEKLEWHDVRIDR
jgi:hypothetical protein